MASHDPTATGVVSEPKAGHIESSEDEHFSDASEGSKQHTPSTPTLRVEKVDDELRHGEVPGTPAYDLRKQDAVPDEIEIRSYQTSSRPESRGSGAQSPIPQVVVEKIDPNALHHGEVPGTRAQQLRQADAQPDRIGVSPDVARTELKDSDSEREDEEQPTADDFDDFAEGSEGDDFGAFDEGITPDHEPTSLEQDPRVSMNDSRSPLTIPNYDGLNSVEEIARELEPYIKTIFPSISTRDDSRDPLPEPQLSLFNERSSSLWSQLVAPPPLQPPNWVRSRIRRLFLVSLGVPVDLDEILPASKQKKLVLPSMDLEYERRSSQAEESRANGATDKQRPENGHPGSASGSTPRGERRKRKGGHTLPDIDLNAARMQCSTTDIALANFTDNELRERLLHLNELKQQAAEVLEYWLLQKDSAIGDKKAFEEVIENLVKHAKKIRK